MVWGYMYKDRAVIVTSDASILKATDMCMRRTNAVKSDCMVSIQARSNLYVIMQTYRYMKTYIIEPTSLLGVYVVTEISSSEALTLISQPLALHAFVVSTRSFC